MPKAIPVVKLGVLVAVLAGALMLAGASSAMAKLVKSDSVSFKTIYNANGEWLISPAAGTGVCKLTSDHEFIPGTTKLEVFPCEMEGHATGIGNPAIEVSSVWASADGLAGVTGAIARVKSEPPKETYTGVIFCEEEEQEEGRVVRYPCEAQVKLVFDTTKKTVSGKYVLFEESTQP